MSDTLMTIIGIFLAVFIMFIFPLTEFAGRTDEVGQTVTQVVVSDFVNKVAKQGKITQFDYDELIQKLSATGNSYDIQIEAQILDDNPRRATTTSSSDMIGEYRYYSVYTNEIIDKINSSENGEYLLKKDDYIVVTVKNTNITLGTQLKNILYKLIGKDTYTVGTSASALVLNAGDDQVNSEGTITSVTPTYTEKTIKLTTRRKTTGTTTTEGTINAIVILDCNSTTMPYHNRNGTSESYITNIINAVSGRGNLAFILTCQPDTIYTDTNDISWIYNATNDTTSSNYVRAFNKAFQWLEDKTENRCIVYLSYQPGKSYLSNAIDTLKSHPSSYDIFFTTYCCHPGGSADQWHNAIGEKSGGDLGTGDIGTRFETLLQKTSVTTSYEDNPSSTITSTDLKITLNNLDIEQEISIIVNNFPYIVGEDIQDYIVYFDNTKGQYVLDLQLLKEILRMSQNEWNSATIELKYSQT